MEVVAGKVWTNAIEVNKVINMKEALMYMYTMKEILVDHRFMEIDQGKNLLLTFVYCVLIVNAMNQFCNSCSRTNEMNCIILNLARFPCIY